MRMLFQILFKNRLPFRADDFCCMADDRDGDRPMKINGLIRTAIDENRNP